MAPELDDMSVYTVCQVDFSPVTVVGIAVVDNINVHSHFNSGWTAGCSNLAYMMIDAINSNDVM